MVSVITAAPITHKFHPALVIDPLIHQVSPAATPTAAPATSSLSRSSSSSAPAVLHHHLLLLLINAIQIAMIMEAAQQKNSAQIVRLDNAFKVAGQWVNNMSKAVEDEPAKVESEGRPSRLGLGAKEVPRQSKARLSNDPVEKRLHAKLEAGKRRAAKIIEDSIVPTRDCNEDDDSDRELESRTSTFAKKRPGPQVQSLQAKKKQK